MIAVNKKILIRAFLILLIVLTLSFIWSNSLANAAESSEKSGNVVRIIKPIIDPENKIEEDIFVTVVRKLAHFSEFTLLGAEMLLLFYTFDKWRNLHIYRLCFPVGTAFLCAVTDELLQLTSPGRSCEFRDMMIDLAGIITGCALSLLVLFLAIKAVALIKYRKQTRR